MALADHPVVLLPIIFYNLVQHLVAGTADRIIRDGEATREVTLALTRGGDHDASAIVQAVHDPGHLMHAWGGGTRQ
jgi:hypothetical protein